MRQRLAKRVELRGRRQFAEDEQVGHFDEVALLGQHLDRVAAVAEDALLAVEERDRAGGRAGVDEALVERDGPGGGPQLRDVDPVFPFGTHDEGQVGRLAVDLQPGGAG